MKREFENQNWSKIIRGFLQGVKMSEVFFSKLAENSTVSNSGSGNNNNNNNNNGSDTGLIMIPQKVVNNGASDKAKSKKRPRIPGDNIDNENLKKKKSRLSSSNNNRDDEKSTRKSTNKNRKHITSLELHWKEYKEKVEKFKIQKEQVENSFAFAFVEGALVKALQSGTWILLDEINLASAETLQRLASILDNPEGTLSLTEKGDVDVLVRHPNFRIFAAMNPATDVGKRDLTPALRHRFTEIYVDELRAESDLQLVCQKYTGRLG